MGSELGLGAGLMGSLLVWTVALVAYFIPELVREGGWEGGCRSWGSSYLCSSSESHSSPHPPLAWAGKLLQS